MGLNSRRRVMWLQSSGRPECTPKRRSKSVGVHPSDGMNQDDFFLLPALTIFLLFSLLDANIVRYWEWRKIVLGWCVLTAALASKESTRRRPVTALE